MAINGLAKVILLYDESMDRYYPGVDVCGVRVYFPFELVSQHRIQIGDEIPYYKSEKGYVLLMTEIKKGLNTPPAISDGGEGGGVNCLPKKNGSV